MDPFKKGNIFKRLKVYRIYVNIFKSVIENSGLKKKKRTAYSITSSHHQNIQKLNTPHFPFSKEGKRTPHFY